MDDRLNIAVISNYGFAAVGKLCEALASIAFGEDYALPGRPAAYPLADEAIERYLGIYQNPGCKLELKKEHDRLHIVMDDEYVLPAYPISKKMLHHAWIDEEYPLGEDENGNPSLWGIAKTGATKEMGS